MSYNPNRQKGVQAKRQRRLDPKAGFRHSEIIAKYGPQAATIDDIRNREQTSRGWRVTILKGGDFEMFYEYICSRNTTGIICHPKKDRAFRILAGELFLTINKEILNLKAGSSYALPKKVEYQLATSGTTDVELIFCQGSDYESGLKQITDSESINNQTNTEFIVPREAPARDQASLIAARKYAAQVAREKQQREHARQHGLSTRVVDEQVQAATQGVEAVTPRKVPGKRQMLPGQAVMGINPRPMGPAGFGDE